jgi:prolipoprotein diacylglyceryltransferase
MLFLNNLSTVPPPDPSYSPQDGSQIAFYIGNIPIAWYGIFMCLAILSAIAVICFKM